MLRILNKIMFNPFKKIINLEKKIVNYLENSKIPFYYFILTFIFATTLRNFLEIFSSEGTKIELSTFLHYDISYVFLALALILLFTLVTKTNAKKVAKVILPSFIILNIAPIIDLILSKGQGYGMAYLLPDTVDNLLYTFLTFFGEFLEMGITIGIRIEVALVLLGSFIYFYIKKQTLLKSLFSTFLTYVIIFLYLASPFVLNWILSPFGFNYEYGLLVPLFLIMIFFISLFLAAISNEKYFMTILRDIRIRRLLHYELMFFLGIVIALKLNDYFVSNTNFLFNLIILPISIVFAWLYSVVTNNIVDYEIDKVSNKGRPLTSSKIPLKDYQKLTWFFLFISLAYALMISFKAFFFIALFIGNYFLYSMPPIRFKRVPFFSKLTISLNSLILVMMGFSLISTDIEFPKTIMLIFLIGFTAAANFIDIKDYKGDKKEGIKTLPVLLGLKTSKILIGFFWFLNYFIFIFLLPDLFMKISVIILGTLQFFLINRENYNEKPVFDVYLFSIICLIIYTLLSKNIIIK